MMNGGSLMRSTTLFLLVTALLAAGSARADDFTMNITVDDQAQIIECAVLSAPGGSGAVKVSVRDDSGIATPPGKPIKIQIKNDTGAVVASARMTGTAAELSGGNYTSHHLSLLDEKSSAVIKDRNGLACMKLLAPAPTEVSATGQVEPEPPSGITLDAGLMNERALAFLAHKQVTHHASTGGVQGKVHRLYHLPDGGPAFPLPAHVSEEDQIELAIVLPSGTAATVDIIA
jgi:hypothetical protein